ncbi:MAG: hypothetical protein IJF92_01820 [Bacilli bacterium]|nr:hypothetical protein [Bacilli bacterium]
MLNKLLFITSIIDELDEKLHTISDKYLSNPSMGLVLFAALLIIAFWAITSFSQK